MIEFLALFEGLEAAAIPDKSIAVLPFENLSEKMNKIETKTALLTQMGKIDEHYVLL